MLIISNFLPHKSGSVCVAERLALPTSDHGVTGSNPAEGEILPEPKRHFIAQSLSCSSFHRLEMTEILLKGRKTLTHPSILIKVFARTEQNFIDYKLRPHTGGVRAQNTDKQKSCNEQTYLDISKNNNELKQINYKKS